MHQQPELAQDVLWHLPGRWETLRRGRPNVYATRAGKGLITPVEWLLPAELGLRPLWATGERADWAMNANKHGPEPGGGRFQKGP